ncbi:MAG: DUF433 domain-containing protein [Deltaproteobacteria bacterium]|jgi:uncharacterized protein (DUF433 family)|nr:DUF433 domain-containing protein [Deltaproteobacteria bacterium]
MEKHKRIEINPDIMFGKPVIKNTRITVEQILRKLAGGMTVEEIITDHPHLKREDILAAQEFAADYLADEEIAFA